VKYKIAPPAKDGKLQWPKDGKVFANADPNAPGHVLVHITVGDPGQIMGVYWTGEPQPGRNPVWHMTAAETNNGMAASPTVTEARISEIPTDVGTAGELMGACVDAGPVSGVISGLACDRSPDVYGVALTPECKTTIVWPTRDRKDDPTTTDDDKETVPSGSDPGTFISTQTGGPTLCGSHGGAKPGPGCKDRIPPVSRFKGKSQASRRRLHFAGSSRDKACTGANGVVSAGKVSKVLVSVAKVRGKGKGKNCRFLTKAKGGKLTAYRNCRRPVLLRASGTRKWKITLTPKSLPRGHYRVVVRGIDASKNKEKPARGRNIRLFRVR
jgi:hypothetical protein